MNLESEAADKEANRGKSLPAHEHIQEYGQGHIKGRHGRVNGWLIAVYSILFAWSLYYLYTYWGGLGPGLDY